MPIQCNNKMPILEVLESRKGRDVGDRAREVRVALINTFADENKILKAEVQRLQHLLNMASSPNQPLPMHLHHASSGPPMVHHSPATLHQPLETMEMKRHDGTFTLFLSLSISQCRDFSSLFLFPSFLFPLFSPSRTLNSCIRVHISWTASSSALVNLPSQTVRYKIYCNFLFYFFHVLFAH
jgi:hypothetical protein